MALQGGRSGASRTHPHTRRAGFATHATVTPILYAYQNFSLITVLGALNRKQSGMCRGPAGALNARQRGMRREPGRGQQFNPAETPSALVTPIFPYEAHGLQALAEALAVGRVFPHGICPAFPGGVQIAYRGEGVWITRAVFIDPSPYGVLVFKIGVSCARDDHRRSQSTLLPL